jgi:hypothetical protein
MLFTKEHAQTSSPTLMRHFNLQADSQSSVLTPEGKNCAREFRGRSAGNAELASSRLNRSSYCYGVGRGAGVGRGRGVGASLGVGVGLAVAVGVGETVAVAAGVAVAVGVGVRVGVCVGVGVGEPNCAQYLPPVLNLRRGVKSPPPQTIISLPVHTAVCKDRGAGALMMLVAVQLSSPGLYLPPVLKTLAKSFPPQTIISLPVHTAV